MRKLGIFDEIYLLNLQRRPERLEISRKRLEFAEIPFLRFGATDGGVLERVWKAHSLENPSFANPSYLACAISHLSIYNHAISQGHQRILILEDDNRVHRNARKIIEGLSDTLVPEWKDLLYLGFIPLTDDLSQWNYSLVSEFISPSVFRARNLWGLFAYGITHELMTELLETYRSSFPMELDRYFVKHIQPRGGSIGVVPQPFCAEDGYSDNSGKVEISMMERSVDSRFARHTDYV